MHAIGTKQSVKLNFWVLLRWIKESARTNECSITQWGMGGWTRMISYITLIMRNGHFQQDGMC